jgi:hypothetical protein
MNDVYKSGFKETVQLFNEELASKTANGATENDIKQASNYKTAKAADPI